MSMVFFVDNIHQLWVTSVNIAPDGVITGFVENGEWNISINTLAKTISPGGGRPISYSTIEVVINQSNSLDYRVVIEEAKARRQNAKVD